MSLVSNTGFYFEIIEIQSQFFWDLIILIDWSRVQKYRYFSLTGRVVENSLQIQMCKT